MNVIIQKYNHLASGKKIPMLPYPHDGDNFRLLEKNIKFNHVADDPLHQRASLPENTPFIVSFCDGIRQLIPLDNTRFLRFDDIAKIPPEINDNIHQLGERNIWVIHGIKSIFHYM